ncbi:MAG: M48 family metalloprotease [Pseudomonadota bacterium]|nr:M48 family metalloprotease [Pseudomonadota bacterium]
MTFRTVTLRTRPRRTFARAALFALPALAWLIAAPLPAAAQGISIIRDTEIERVLGGYERPLLEAAGIPPDTVKMRIVDDPSLNAFAAQSPYIGDSEDIFVNTGTFLQLKTPNQLVGILAHETGHIAGGDVIRGGLAMEKASIPMLIGMAVGVAAMIAGGGEAGMGAIMMGQQAAMAQYLEFSRAQESTADQRGLTYLDRTHQSPEGMLQVFSQMAQEQAMSADYNKQFMSDHPADRERIDELQNRVNASPYKGVKDSPAVVHEFHMIQAKLIGYISDPDAVLGRYPASDGSDEAYYARAMAYFRKPDMNDALAQINTLIKRHPENPYFWEMLGQIYVEMSKPDKGVAPYQKSVDLLPDAPLLRVALAAAQLAVEKQVLVKPALENLKVALQQENDSTFAWYEVAQAYSQLGNQPMADLSTAERFYWSGGMKQAAMFASRAEKKLPKGSIDWQRANDIVAVAGSQTKHD